MWSGIQKNVPQDFINALCRQSLETSTRHVTCAWSMQKAQEVKTYVNAVDRLINGGRSH